MEFGDRDLSSAIAHLTRGVEAADTSAGVRWLGTRRGEDGVALADAFADLTTALRVASGLDPTDAEIRDLALAWSEGAFAALHRRGALDPATGLTTEDYLATRLRDLARHRRAPEHRLLLIGAGPTTHRLAVILRAGRLATEVLATFPEAETPARLSGDRIGAIIRDDAASPAGVAGLQRAVHRIDAGTPTGAVAHTRAEVRTLELPGMADEVTAFLDAL